LRWGRAQTTLEESVQPFFCAKMPSSPSNHEAPLILAFLTVLMSCASLSTPSLAQLRTSAGNRAVVEQGKFRLHKFEQPIGEETYEIIRDGNSLTAKVDFKFTDRGTDVPLSATFRGAQDLTPESFAIKGKTSRDSDIDEAVDVQLGEVRVRSRDKWSATAPPSHFFTIAGYSPATMQMLMVRYWTAHGSPAELPTFPLGEVKIEPRGQDTITVNGKNETLSRYTIEGLIWGRETLWFDNQQNLVAEVSLDAELDHFEAIREGDESALQTFVGRAGADNMAALADLARGISVSRAETLALVGGMLIDGTDNPAIPDAVVLVKKGQIIKAGPRLRVKIPRTATVIDVHGKTILPGLWDMHAHFEQVEWGPIYLAAGVTTVRDCGNEFEFITAVRDAIAHGRGLGPRILAAGIVDGSGKLALGVQRVDTPKQARIWTDRYHAAGFREMKIYSSVKLEEVKAVAAEAHRLGMTVTGHVPEGLNAYQVIEAGQDQINHINYVADIMHAPLAPEASRQEENKANVAIDLNSAEAQKAISFLKSHNTVIDPTLAIFEFLTATTANPPSMFEPGVAKVAPELAQQLTDVDPPSERSELRKALFEKELAIVGALHRAGIPIVAGTDQTVPGHSLHREIELYAQAGFTPIEAIQAATIVPARVMGLDKEVGTIEAGKRADLIILDGNPLEDIHNTRKVEYVITDGIMYKAAELWRSVGFRP
jgi:imidazolonepropionase-like amidohydrolase